LSPEANIRIAKRIIKECGSRFEVGVKRFAESSISPARKLTSNTAVGLLFVGWLCVCAPATAGCGDHLLSPAGEAAAAKSQAPPIDTPMPCFSCGERLPAFPAAPTVDSRPSVEESALVGLHPHRQAAPTYRVAPATCFSALENVPQTPDRPPKSMTT
jgi:hypothetical protein